MDKHAKFNWFTQIWRISASERKCGETELQIYKENPFQNPRKSCFVHMLFFPGLPSITYEADSNQSTDDHQWSKGNHRYWRAAKFCQWERKHHHQIFPLCATDFLLGDLVRWQRQSLLGSDFWGFAVEPFEGSAVVEVDVVLLVALDCLTESAFSAGRKRGWIRVGQLFMNSYSCQIIQENFTSQQHLHTLLAYINSTIIIKSAAVKHKNYSEFER